LRDITDDTEYIGVALRVWYDDRTYKAISCTDMEGGAQLFDVLRTFGLNITHCEYGMYIAVFRDMEDKREWRMRGSWRHDD
jgi:alpha-galactosidase/6-phospho-beta-glucosidase family protein